MRPDDSRGISRRDFVRSAVAIGGTSALAACLDSERAELDGGADQRQTATDDGPEFPRGDPDGVPEGQHRWGASLVRDSHGNTVPPQQVVAIGLSYEGSTTPSAADRDQVESALQLLERAFQWGTGDNAGAIFNRGLLFLLGYAPSYFERVGDVPEGLLAPDEVLETVGEDPAKGDAYDALLVLTSDLGSVLLSAEEALLGELDEVNGLPVDATFDGVFSKAGRHTGYIGKGLPADKLDHDDIPEDVPLSMGFKSGFADNLPSEDRVTIDEGPMAGGTTIASSTLRIDLDRWYDQSHQDRTAEMFCPAHSSDDVGPVGEKLGSDSGITPEDAENLEAHAEEYGRVGHSQKLALARDEDFEARILRRTEGVATTVHDGAGFQFNSVQATMDDFVETRKAMNPEEYDFDVPDDRHGIADYLETIRRGSYLAPPREKRALPVV